MGGYTFCSICGGPPNSVESNFYDLDDFLEVMEDFKYEGNLNKAEEKKLTDLFPILKRNTKWLDDFGGILENGKYISNKIARFTDDNFKLNRKIIYFPGLWNQISDSQNNRAFLVHEMCYKIFKSKTKENIFKLMESLVPSRGIDLPEGYLYKIDYGKIRFYSDEIFSWSGLIKDAKFIWITENPSKSKENCKRILGIIQQIMKKSSSKSKRSPSKSRASRPSPSESATKFKVGTKRKGNDGNRWVVKENKNGTKRWVKY